MARVTPRIQAEGRYELRSPWAEVMPTATVFVCQAIRSFVEIENENIDVYETFYEDMGVSQSDFRSDVAENAHIITLMSQDRQTIIFVPDTYILYAPTGDNVVCDQIVLSVNVGVVPAYKDLTAIKEGLSSKLKEMMGVDQGFNENRIPSVRTISQEDNDIAEAAREAIMEYQQSPEATIRMLQKQLAETSLKLEDAYAWMRDNGGIQTV